MNTWICTKDKKWQKKWDEFVLADKNSSFVQCIHRVRSYEKYGMDWELLICTDQEENILIGSANVIVNFFSFRLYVSTYGPTVHSQIVTEKEYEAFFSRFIQRAQELKVFASQISIPIRISRSYLCNGIEGPIFSITSLRYSNLIKLKNDEKWLSKEELIQTFTPNGRRDSRASYRRGLVSKLAKSESELQVAYSCFEANAGNKGYYVRSWNDMSELIIEGVNSEIAFMLTAWYNSEIQGAILLERSNNMLSYTMGGVYRHSPDLLTGYFLQVEAMMLASSMGLEFYDISYGGPKEVQRFKSIFNPLLLERGKTIHFKHKSLQYFIFSKLYENFKNFIPKLVSIKKKIVR